MSSTTFDAPMSKRSCTAPRRSTVRLTRRGRVVVFVLALAALLAVGLFGAGISGAAQHGGTLPTHTVVVGPGDTLWDLASDAAGGGSTLDMEQRIKDLNGLESGMLVAGQVLRIPN